MNQQIKQGTAKTMKSLQDYLSENIALIQEFIGAFGQAKFERLRDRYLELSVREPEMLSQLIEVIGYAVYYDPTFAD